jgi:hypothetical protein
LLLKRRQPIRHGFSNKWIKTQFMQ